MCTAITIRTAQGNTCFGRTMDFSYPLDPELYISPRGYEWNNLAATHRIRSRYSFIGAGQDLPPVIFADGVNEMGFGAAVLYFPGYAQYDTVDSGDGLKDPRPPIAAIELVSFLLGLCASVSQAATLLDTIRIVGQKDSVTNTVAPLHWILADQDGACMAVERTGDGLRLMDNPMGVLANSPDFQWHMTNLRNYMDLSPYQPQDADWGSVRLAPFGQGAGTLGLPGDFTPPSRFVRAAYLKSHSPIPSSQEEALNTGFHILENVSIPKGAVMTDRETADYTQYTAMIDLSARKYSFRTYDNSRTFSAYLEPGRDYGRKMVSLGRLNSPDVTDSWDFMST
ncbi:choloylglycine hydrolase family protein [Enterocloster hominis (ex Hitch et al. 2024)]|uniref:Choloylglycine hydrolase family protein n=1 Tax=Enterocloster hominis (ex Hitch et al. 2024) TaxID=1917870 RepID=A0ABV1D6V1_9FIRM